EEHSQEFKSKKAYIVWDVPEEETTSSTSSEEESAKLCLMVRSDNNGNSDSHEDNDEDLGISKEQGSWLGLRERKVFFVGRKESNHRNRSDNNGNSDSHEDNDEVYSDTSSTSDDLPSYEVLYNAYVELHEELKKLARINVDKKREVLRNERN
ncbi:hypothetical protein Lal_00045171, partial [Lupinus albus]